MGQRIHKRVVERREKREAEGREIEISLEAAGDVSESENEVGSAVEGGEEGAKACTVGGVGGASCSDWYSRI